MIHTVHELKAHIPQALYHFNGSNPVNWNNGSDSARPSAVLFLLGEKDDRGSTSSGPCLILNKRSSVVKQAGDLCCPGGGISLPRDANLAKLLYLPGSPLKRWRFWQEYREKHGDIGSLATLLAASLRECYEEMRLNPLRVTFLGMLPVQRLGSFGRAIYPMVGWASHQKRYRLNWEVDKIVSIPLANLLNTDGYALTRFEPASVPDSADRHNWNDYPCFIHKQPGEETEILWGATYRIVMLFLKIVFDFTPPDQSTLSHVPLHLNRNYYTGGRKD